MTRIKKLTRKDYDAFIDIVANAYPGMQIVTRADKERTRRLLVSAAKRPGPYHYAAYRKNTMVGGMALYDFMMNLSGAMIRVGGIGLVAVDLLHKKEKICRDMVIFFMDRYHKEKVHLVALYPFRPDFYKKMGFGYGTLLNQYSIKPGDLPRTSGKSHVHFLHKRDIRSIKACHARFLAQRHGMMTDRETKWIHLFDNPQIRVAGYKQGPRVTGYIIFTFRKAHETNWIKNDLVIREFVYESREAFSGLIAFLHSQSDQVNRILYGTQDEYFHHILHDTRSGSDNLLIPLAHETNTQGIGLMYRVIDMRGLFNSLTAHRFGAVTMCLKITVIDSFYPSNADSTIVCFTDGRPRIQKKGLHDVEITLDISDFSSLLVGAVDFKHLYRFGLADISDERHVQAVDQLFRTAEKPLCMTQF
jgi:predicted acetyltransferase